VTITDAVHGLMAERDRLRAEVESLRAQLASLRGEQSSRCPVLVKGERCCLPMGHDGGHQWAGGD
jgi:hypothetical protein